MYERKKRDSVRAPGSASYVSRRHFSTICQSPPFFFSLLLSPFYRALICIVSRRGHRRSQTAFVEHSLSSGKNGGAGTSRAGARARSSILPARIQTTRLRTSRHGRMKRRSECNISTDDVYFIKKTWISLSRRCGVFLKSATRLPYRIGFLQLRHAQLNKYYFIRIFQQ